MQLFKCSRCGFCCTHIKGVNMGQVHGLTLLPNEIGLFQAELVKPVMRFSHEDPIAPGKVFLYQLDVDVCPHYDEAIGCRIYSKRPLICVAFPLEISFKGPFLHGDCPEAARIFKEAPGSYNITRGYVEAALKVHNFYKQRLHSFCLERFDLSVGRWRGLIEGLSEEDVIFLRR